MAKHAIVDIDMNHPSVGAALVKRKQSGSFPVDKVQKILMDAGVPDGLMPKAPTLTVALKRAMEDACKGDSSLEVKVTGRKGTSVYTIVHTDKNRLDRDTDNGKGVSDAELTGKIEFDPNGNFSVKFSPSQHPSEDLIRRRMDHHCGQFSNVYDIGVWIGQQLMPFVGAIPTGSGDYFLPKGDGFDLVNRVQKAFMEINSGASFVRFYMLPQIATFADTVDVITDSLLDEIERTCGDIQKKLEDDETPVGRRGLASLTERANQLRAISDAFSKSLNMAFEDIEPRIAEVEKSIAYAELRLSK